MRFDLNVLQHLGLRMYSSLPAVISEYVANAWDAWATEVNIEMSQEEQMSPEYTISIEDDGIGMTKEEVNSQFLVVGRNRRQAEGKDYTEKDGRRREVMGRKGIGKLAGFGIADVVSIRTCKDGEFVEFELDYGEMKREAEQDKEATTTYRPRIVDEGQTSENSGTRVLLTDLDRENRPRAKYVRQRLARRFSVIGDDFSMKVNGDEVTGDERNLKERCEFVRTYDDLSIGGDRNNSISGWIGTLPKPTPENVQGGVAVMARGKTVQKPITFGVAEGGVRGQMALQYLVGEIHADFLDDDEDLIATHRSQVLWDKPRAENLRDFIVSEIEEICSQWPERRREEQMEDLREEESYERYIKPLDDRERELADTFLGELAKKGDYDDETLGEMASYVSSGVQQKSFQKLLKEIENSDISNTDRLVELFDQYEVLDAMNSLRIVRGRFHAIQKFEQLIEEGESDLKDLHGFVSDNPWIIDPRWDYLDEELKIRDEIQLNFDNIEQESRVGFITLGDSDSLRLVDIRKTDYIIQKSDLDQFKEYIDYLRSTKNMEPVSGRDVEGYIIARDIADTRAVESEVRRMKMDDMRIRTFDEIKDIARRSHKAFLDVFERKAERTDSDMLQTYLSESEQLGLDEFSTEG